VSKPGGEYEELTERVFSRLLEQEQLCAQVERDVLIQGKATTHQIDVTFQFVYGGTTYRTIVQCKDWRSPVKQEQVLTFKAVLDDIPGQPRGIMVSRAGFQAGARRTARHHGIKLYELRAPKDEDWDGLIRSVHIRLHMRIPRFERVRLIPDHEATRNELAARNIRALDIKFSGHPLQAPVRFASGEPCDLNRILNKLVPQEGSGAFPVLHRFDEPVYVEVPNAPIPLPLEAIEATIHVGDHCQDMHINIDHLIAYAFRDVIEGNVTFLGKDGGPVKDSVDRNGGGGKSA
jgi:hypothetical protein